MNKIIFSLFFSSLAAIAGEDSKEQANKIDLNKSRIQCVTVSKSAKYTIDLDAETGTLETLKDIKPSPVGHGGQSGSLGSSVDSFDFFTEREDSVTDNGVLTKGQILILTVENPDKPNANPVLKGYDELYINIETGSAYGRLRSAKVKLNNGAENATARQAFCTSID